jgi:RHS repeat-associated protein
LNRTIKFEREGGVSREITKYDGTSSRIKEQTAPHFATSSGPVTRFDYDPAGRLISVQNPDSTSRSIRYDVGLRTARDELGARTGYEIDVFGRISAVNELRRNCFRENCPIVETGTTHYSYDALDRLLSIVDAKKNKTEIGWDSLGRRRYIHDPDRGALEFQWNDDDTKASETDATGSLRFIYDIIGRRSAQVSYGSSGSKTREIFYSWDRDPQTGSPAGASIGRIARVEDKSANALLSASFHYDTLGRIDTQTKCIDAKCFQLHSTFDPAGRIKKIIYPDKFGHTSGASVAVDYVYDNSGWLSSLPGYVSKIERDAYGHATHIQFENGVQEARQYDPARGWASRIDVLQPSAPRPSIFNQTLVHDPVGRVKNQDVTSSHGTTHHDEFGHDDLGRLTGIVSSDPARTGAFQYDLLGNIISHPQMGTVLYKDLNHVHAVTDTSSGEHFEYDSIGQMLKSNLLNITWTTEHRPSGITNSSTGVGSKFAYDSNGVRVKSDINGNVTLTPYPFVDFNSQGEVISYVFAEGRNLVRLEPTTRYFLHADFLGSTRLATDTVGKPVDEDDYAVWGEDTRLTSHSANPYRFVGSRADLQTGLVYMDARYYSPKLTRFISADPIVPNIYIPQSLNHYSYALNDPVTLTDPTGLAPEGNVLGRPQDIIDDKTENERSLVLAPGLLTVADLRHPEVFPSAEPDYPTSAISEWSPYLRPPSLAPLVAAHETQAEFQADRRRENLLCGICHAPDPSTVHRGTESEVKMYGYAMLAMLAAPTGAAGVAAAAEVAGGGAVLGASVRLYLIAPRIWNFAQTAAAAALGVPATWPTPGAVPAPSPTIPVLTPADKVTMARQALDALRQIPNGERVAAYRGMAQQIMEATSGEWQFSEEVLNGGRLFIGDRARGFAIFIDSAGNVTYGIGAITVSLKGLGWTWIKTLSEF